MAATMGPYRIEDTRIVGADGTPVVDCRGAMGGEDTGADKRLLAASWGMRELLARIVNNDPIYNDSDDGPFCTFCMVQWAYYPATTSEHKTDCEWAQARALLARIDETEVQHGER